MDANDRSGRKILTQWYCVFLVVFGIPVFYVLYHAAIQRNLWMAVVGTVTAAMLKLAYNSADWGRPLNGKKM